MVSHFTQKITAYFTEKKHHYVNTLQRNIGVDLENYTECVNT